MDRRVEEFLKTHRVSVIAISQADGTLHAAALHYSFASDVSFFFITEKESEKCKSLLDGSIRPASVVIGFSEEEFVTFQADGQVVMITDVKHPGWDVYIDKYPTRSRAKLSEDYVLLQFVPSVWKYQDRSQNQNYLRRSDIPLSSNSKSFAIIVSDETVTL